MTASTLGGHRARQWLGVPGVVAWLLAVVAGARAEETFFAARIAPVLEEHCVVCHGDKKKPKGGLRLTTYASLMLGGKDGAVVKPGDLKGSELFRRITLPPHDEDFMPSDDNPPLSAEEVKVLELWIAAGASDTQPLSAIAGAPPLATKKIPGPPCAPDWRPQLAQIAALEKTLGVRLVPRSQLPTDGLVLRTASAPARCNDSALAQLQSVADLIVDAELARTKISDAGLDSIARFANLRSLDLSHTAVTSAGLASLAPLKKLESLNLTATVVDDSGVARLRPLPALKRIWLFGTRATLPDTVVAGSAQSSDRPR